MCLTCRGRAQGSQGSGGVVFAFLFLGLLVLTHSSEMTTSGNKGDSSKRGVRRRGQLRGGGGAPAGEASQAAQRGRRCAADSR